MDKEDKIALVLEEAPKDYAEILAIMEQEKGSSLAMKDVNDATKTQFCIWYGYSKVQGDGDELALSAFDGKCYKCGLLGHIANKCPKNKCGKFNGKCNRYDRIGHKLDECWENEKNANKRPISSSQTKKRDWLLKMPKMDSFKTLNFY
eukprot:15332909-Ditylum_brightwellii.AAC.2